MKKPWYLLQVPWKNWVKGLKKIKGGSMLSGERLKEEDSIKKREKGHITFWVINYRHFRRGGGSAVGMKR